MIDVFKFYSNGLIAATMLILCVLLLRFVFRKQSKLTLNILWLFVLVRLLLPFSISFPADYSVPSMLNTDLFSGVREFLNPPATSDLITSLVSKKLNQGIVPSSSEDVDVNPFFSITEAGDAANHEMSAFESGITTDHELSVSNSGNTTGYDASISDAAAHATSGNNPADGYDLASSENTASNFNTSNTQSGNKTDYNASITPTNDAYSSSAYTLFLLGSSVQAAYRILTTVWLCGIIIMTVITSFQLFRLHKIKKSATKSNGDEQVYLWEDDKNACVIGILRPRIYVPDTLTGTELDMVLLHERTHIKRHDPLVLFLYYIALILNWYHPLVWVSYFLVQQDIELACDEQALARAGAYDRQVYAKTLLLLGASRRTEQYLGVAFGKGSLKKRLLHIGESHEKHSLRTALTALALAAAMSLSACSISPSMNTADNAAPDSTNTTAPSNDAASEAARQQAEMEENIHKPTEQNRLMEQKAIQNMTDAANQNTADQAPIPITTNQITNTYFSLELPNDIVGHISYRIIPDEERGDCSVIFYSTDNLEAGGELLYVTWHDFTEYLERDTNSDSAEHTMISKALAATDSLRFDMFLPVYDSLSMPYTELVLWPNLDNSGGYTISNPGDVQWSPDHEQEYLACASAIRTAVLYTYIPHRIPFEELTRIQREQYEARYQLTRKELSDGTIQYLDYENPSAIMEIQAEMDINALRTGSTGGEVTNGMQGLTGSTVCSDMVSEVKNLPIGAELPTIIYADETRLILSDYYGVLEYDLSTNTFVSGIRYSDFNLWRFSDDNTYLYAFADSDGRYVYFQNEFGDLGGQPGEIWHRQENGETKELEYQSIPKQYRYDIEYRVLQEYSFVQEWIDTWKAKNTVDAKEGTLELRSDTPLTEWQQIALDDGSVLHFGYSDIAPGDMSGIVYTIKLSGKLHYLFDSPYSASVKESLY